MKTKPLDILYCGVSEETIKTSKPKMDKINFELLGYWISERYKIHLKKDFEKIEAPWTKDKILSNYRFCNVRREQDKESKWLIKNVCEDSDLKYKNKLLNCILFRLINKSETLKIFKRLDFDNLDYSSVRKKLNLFHKENPDYVYFSNAFFTSGPKSVANLFFGKEEDMIIKIIKLVEKYYLDGIIEKVTSSKSQKEVYENLKSLRGIGPFLGYQIFVDFSYIPEFPYSENEFVIAGPGCIKGLRLLFKNFNTLSYEESLFWIRDNQKGLFSKKLFENFSDLPEEERKLNIMCLENCMCEFSKYWRAKNKKGRPRIRYKYEN